MGDNEVKQDEEVSKNKKDNSGNNIVKKISIAIPLLALLVILILTCTTTIKQGHVGAVYDRFKKGIQGYTLSEGINFKTPWQSVNEFPVSIETVYMSKDMREGSEADESILISCNDGSLSADLTFSYRFKTEDVPKVQRQYRGKGGQEIMNSVLRGQLRSWISEVTKNYSTMEVHLTKKEVVNEKLTEHLNKKAEKYGVMFENVSLAETRASKEVQAAIEKRQQISQEVEQQRLQLEKAEIAKQAAQLEAEKKIIQAEGEKKANEIKAQGLDERILREQYIKKWDGKLPQVVGSDSSILTNLGE
ncbi:prohibitin family protein [Romboutsia weinsteinii]|uniref:Prohibitin family protein n=1 Tax=Romboutsia weinsteinii TaxID=2020949 RepID=A0A371J184_9FIRM|nr:prohibitin family protein [Romboutsia weinsteinii]RDY26551.1 prohibitin family protein [Romboutsia weinsteinii]